MDVLLQLLAALGVFAVAHWSLLVAGGALLALAAVLWYDVAARVALGKIFALVGDGVRTWLHTTPIPPELCGAIAQLAVDTVYDALPAWLAWVRFVVPRLAAIRALADLLINLEGQAAAPAPAP